MAEELRQQHIAREANQPPAMQIDSAPAIAGPLAEPLANPFSAVAGSYQPIQDGGNGAEQAPNLQQVFNAIRFQQSNILLPQPQEQTTSLADIAASVANLSNSVALFGTAGDNQTKNCASSGRRQ